MQRFTIRANSYLGKDTVAFCHTDYLGSGRPGNPEFICDLKNDRRNRTPQRLIESAAQLGVTLHQELPVVHRKLGVEQLHVCVVPRAKKASYYQPDQLLFRYVVSEVARDLRGFADATSALRRHTSTFTTHLRRTTLPNDGRRPYPGITRDTCHIDEEQLRGRNVLLVDDVYTRTVNVVEDAVEALLRAGARRVAVYVIGRTLSPHMKKVLLS